MEIDIQVEKIKKKYQTEFAHLRMNMCQTEYQGKLSWVSIVEFRENILSHSYFILMIQDGLWIGFAKTVAFQTVLSISVVENKGFIKPIPKCNQIPFISIESCSADDNVLMITSKIFGCEQLKLKFKDKNLLKKWKSCLDDNLKQKRGRIKQKKNHFMSKEVKDSTMNIQEHQAIQQEQSGCLKQQKSCDLPAYICQLCSEVITQNAKNRAISDVDEKKLNTDYLQGKIEGYELIRQKLETQVRGQDAKLKVLLEQKQKQNKELVQLRENFRNIETELDKQKQYRKSIQTQNDRLRSLNKSINQEKIMFSTQISRLRQQIQMLSLQKTVSEQKMQSIFQELNSNHQSKIRELQIKCKQITDLLSAAYKANQNLQEKFIISAKKNEDQINQLHQINKKLTEQSYLHIFEGIVFQKELYSKIYLKQQLERCTSQRILNTRLLYHSSFPFLTINPHRLIDDLQNIVLLIRLQNGYTIGAYSQSGFCKTKNYVEKNYIFSLTNRIVFLLLQSKNGVSYDEYYILFGNADLRIRSGEKVLFSNFGKPCSSYKMKGHKTVSLLGATGNEFPIAHYQIHELKFRETE